MIGNVMIIDDSPVDRKMIRYILQKRLRGVKLFEAEDGMNIEKKLLENNIHACILDIMLPSKSGFQVLKEMKENPGLMDIPVIVCTALEAADTIERALEMGAYDYFSKPLSEEAMKISLPLKVRNAIELMKRKDEIIYLSYHDKLTGLYNRRYCEEELKRLDNDRSLPLSLVMGDINGLKLTNDAFGHEAGDRLLIRIADIIRNECRKGEIAARIGGDEFLLVLPETTISDAEKIVTRILKKCGKEKDDPIKPSISMGCCAKEYIYQDIMAVFKTAEDRMYSKKLMEGKSVRSAILASLIKTMQENSGETEEHCKRMTELSEKLGNAMGLSSDQIHNLKLLTLLHEIGVTALPDYFMTKNQELTPYEKDILKNHCEIGYRIASSLPDIAHIANDIMSHHERWDGKGYPEGLAGNDIPLYSRIVSILDTYDYMVNGIFGDKQVSAKEAAEYIKSQAGSCFDPAIVEVFLRVIKSGTLLKNKI